MEGAHRPGGLTAARRVPGHVVFFPAAAAYALAALPLSILALLGRVPPVPGLALPATHAHELLFGFALAVVAGNQLGPTLVPRLALLAGAWLAARVAFLAAPGSIAAAALNAAFAMLLALQVAPRLLGRAKKWRNRALPVVLLALCACVLAFELALRAAPGLEHRVLRVGTVVIALLMLFMGGRIIAPAVAGQAWRQGGDLAARVQPRLEGALVVAMATAVVASALPETHGARVLAGAALLLAAFLAAVRMARWRLWTLRGRPDLLCLAAGYGWLTLGLAALGLAILSGERLVASIHLVTVGAIGTLTINVMALTWLRLARRDPARARLPVWGTLCIAVATVARVLADYAGDSRPPLLLSAALAWSVAYALLLALFGATRRPDASRPQA